VGYVIIPHNNRKDKMLNAEQAIESIQRDRDTLKLISGLQDNVRTLKEIIDQLEWRIRRLEDNE
tara:strand:+ start:160 stop:351 length:192 start_codon:yes stop_codon:yes gene_type:complete